MIKITNFRGDLTDISAKKDLLPVSPVKSLARCERNPGKPSRQPFEIMEYCKQQNYFMSEQETAV